MFRKILETIFSKGFTAVCNLLILLITAKYLGAYGRGEMAVIVLGITIVGIFQNIFSGAVLTYLVPRFQLIRLLATASLWNLLMAFILPFILVYSGLFPEHYHFDLIVLSFILGSISLIQSSLLGLEEINRQNLIEITKAFSSVTAMVFLIVLQKKHFTGAVIESFYWSYSVTLALAVLFLLPKIAREKSTESEHRSFLTTFFKIGFQMQLNNISQMINYRFCYYLIEKTLGLAALGIFSVATSLVEIIWIICKSISSIHYSKSVNLKSAEKQILLTQRLSKMSLILTVPSVLILLLLPNDLFSWILGKSFGDFKPLFLSLAPGVLFLAVFTIFNHHFSGVEKNMINVKASLLGNIITVTTGFLTIQHFGILAGGIATSAAYFGMFLYLFRQFNKMYGLSFSWFSFSKQEIKSAFDLKVFES